MTEVYEAITRLHELGQSVSLACRVLDVSRSAYYQFQQGLPSNRKFEDQRLKPMIRTIFWKHKRRFGARRISQILAADGEVCGRLRVGRLMCEMDLQAIQPKSFRPKTTESRHRLGYSPNLLKNAKAPTAINEIWVCDITYIPLSTWGFAYAALIMDRYSRRIIGWKIDKHMQENLVLAALRMAIRRRQPQPGTIHHSDRGGQYAGSRYRAVLQRAAMVQSMSRAGNCYDNAFMESCFGTIKTELEVKRFTNSEIARKKITEYIRYYNTARIHSSLGYLTPHDFEQESHDE